MFSNRNHATRAYVSLGSNLGDRVAHLDHAVSRLQAFIRPLKVSRYYETASEGNAFWHWGDNPGFKSFALGMRGSSRGVVVMTNADNGRRVCATVVRHVLGLNHPALAWLAAPGIGCARPR